MQQSCLIRGVCWVSNVQLRFLMSKWTLITILFTMTLNRNMTFLTNCQKILILITILFLKKLTNTFLLHSLYSPNRSSFKDTKSNSCCILKFSVKKQNSITQQSSKVIFNHHKFSQFVEKKSLIKNSHIFTF